MAEEVLKLYHPVPGQRVEVYEIAEQTLTQHSKSGTADADEIEVLIQSLLELLPEDRQQKFKLSIKTESMI